MIVRIAHDNASVVMVFDQIRGTAKLRLVAGPIHKARLAGTGMRGERGAAPRLERHDAMIARVDGNEQALARLDQTAGLVEPRLRAHAIAATRLLRHTGDQRHEGVRREVA